MIFTQYWDVRKFLSFSERRHRSNPVWIPNVSNHTCSPPMVLWDVVWEEKNAHKQHLGSEDPQIRRSILSAVTIEMALLGGITPTPGALKKCPFSPTVFGACIRKSCLGIPVLHNGSRMAASTLGYEADPLPSEKKASCKFSTQKRVCEPDWKR